MSRIRSKLTFANVTSMIALLVALSGTALALQDNTVRSRHIVDNSVKSIDVRDGSLTDADIDQFQSGDTLRGAIGARDNVGTSLGAITALDSLDFRHPLYDADITVDGGSDETNNVCQGTPTHPTAPPGMVCVYPIATHNANNIRGLSLRHDVYGFSWSGFRIAWEPTTANALTSVEATWAFTMP